MTYSFYDRNMPREMKVKFYCTVTRPVVLYGTKCLVLKSQQQHKLSVAQNVVMYEGTYKIGFILNVLRKRIDNLYWGNMLGIWFLLPTY